MKTAVEQLERQILDNWMDILRGKVHIGDLFDQAKKMEKEQVVNFALFRDDYLEKANTLEDFTIPNEDLVKLFKQQEQ
jgi:hypothetical protein